MLSREHEKSFITSGPRDKMPHSVASDLSLHCLLKFVCPNT